MARRLPWVLLLLGWALAAPAAVGPATITGTVKNLAGVPQMGATVQVLSAGATVGTVFTDDHGRFTFASLKPGIYDVRVSAPSFLPTQREGLQLSAGGHAILSLHLATLFEALQLQLNTQHGPEDEEDWKWTLRANENRPILRVLPDGSAVMSERGDGHDVSGAMRFVAGSTADGYGGDAGMSTVFSVHQEVFGNGKWSLAGNVGYDNNSPATLLHAAYTHQFSNGSHPEIALTARRYAAPVGMPGATTLDALAVSMRDGMSIGNVVELNYGGEMQMVQFVGTRQSFRPFGSVDVHLSPNLVVEYAYTTSQPSSRHAGGVNDDSQDALDAYGPRLSLLQGTPELERTRHQELSVSRRLGKHDRVQAAFYSDRISNAALVGAGDATDESGFLADVYSNTFTYDAGSLGTNGWRVVVQHEFSPLMTATADYSSGGVLDVDGFGTWQQMEQTLHTVRRHAIAFKLSGKVPRGGTRWLASYKCMNADGLTPVDLFNVSAGQADPYLNVSVRQPLPTIGFLPGHMEALLDIRNLLAQGYIPVLANDGHTLYLVQTARSVRGGLAFTF
jgi:hypothetical protein